MVGPGLTNPRLVGMMHCLFYYQGSLICGGRIVAEAHTKPVAGHGLGTGLGWAVGGMLH